MIRFAFVSLFALFLAGPAAAESAAVERVEVPWDVSYPGSDGAEHTLRALLGDGELLVVTFFSATCPCQAAHDPRLLELHERWSGEGVRFVAVDAEANSSLARDVREQKRRGYPFPILSDPPGTLADIFGAKFATYTVIVGKDGTIHYRGGIDDDKRSLRPNATLYVQMALDRLAAGEAPNPRVGKAMGCFLRRP